MKSQINTSGFGRDARSGEEEIGPTDPVHLADQKHQSKDEGSDHPQGAGDRFGHGQKADAPGAMKRWQGSGMDDDGGERGSARLGRDGRCTVLRKGQRRT